MQALSFRRGVRAFTAFLFLATPTVIQAQDTWAARAPMPAARRFHAAAEHLGKIYVFGGCSSTCYQPPFEPTIDEEVRNEMYDPVANTWAAKANIPETFFMGAAAAPGNGKLYIFGGYYTPNSVHEYDPVANTWAAKALMPTGRHSLQAVAVGGKVYVLGGSGPSNANEQYDPATNTWTAKAPMPTARLIFGAAAVNGRIYTVGGSPDCCGNTQTDVVEEYDPNTDTWTTKAPLPASRQTSAVAAINGRLYAFGGFFVCCQNLDETYEYNPLTNTWTNRAPLPTPLDEAPAIVANGKVYVPGGAVSGRNASAGNYEYTPPPPACTVNVTLAPAAGVLNVAFTLGTALPAQWATWLTYNASVVQLWSIAVPAVQPAVSFSVPLPIPALGVVGVLSTLSTSPGGMRCVDFEVANTL